MKKLLNILMIILIYFSFCGKSCDDDSAPAPWQQKQVDLARDTIQREFEADYLTEEARHAAEVNAMQKLNDLADYVEIFSDQPLDIAFREKAGEMISEMFGSEKNKLSFGRLKGDKMETCNLKEFLEKGFGKDIARAEMNFDSIRVDKSLEKSAEGIYSGRLSASQSLIFYTGTDSIISPVRHINVEFNSSKLDKVIGNDTFVVWKVLLGDM